MLPPVPTRLAVAHLSVLLPVALAAASPAPRAPAPTIELNLSGNETAGLRLDKDYVLPKGPTLRYFAAKGLSTIRLPMNWSRLQPKAGGPLSEPKLAELDAFLGLTDRVGVRVIPDLHEFGRKDGHALGSPELPTSALADFWERFARRFAGRLAGYDLMNEPHDMPSPRAWPEAAQAAVDAIRRVDRKTIIYVEGDDWSHAARWDRSNAGLDIRDPAGRMVYSAHIYFDKDTSGQYRLPFDRDGATPATGPERLRPFTDWLRQRGLRGHIGEFGVPGDPGWLAVLDGFLDAVRANGDVLTGAAYWAGGEWLDRYDLTVQPAKDGRWRDRPQMAVLLRRQQGSVHPSDRSITPKQALGVERRRPPLPQPRNSALP